MKKICHMTNVHTSTDRRVFYKECSSLAKAGYEVYLVAPGESREENGVHIVGIGPAPASRISRMTWYARRAYRAARRLDCELYHLHDPEMLPYGYRLKRRGKKVIFDSHENTLEQMVEKPWIPRILRRPVNALYARYASRIFRKLDALVTVTPDLNDMLLGLNPNTVMVTNYPILSKEAPAADKRDPHTLCFAGGIIEPWNHVTILRAMEAVPEAKYLLCGSGPEPYMESLRQQPAWDRVSYLGLLPKSEVKHVYEASSVGMALCAYSNRTFGKVGTLGNTKLFEYMDAAMPIICTDYTLWQELVEKYPCGICVNPTDAGAVAEAIRYLFEHPDEAKRMGETGRRAVLAEYNWDTQEKKLLALYEQLGNE